MDLKKEKARTLEIIAGHHNSMHFLHGLDSVAVRGETIGAAGVVIVPVFYCLRGTKASLAHKKAPVL